MNRLLIVDDEEIIVNGLYEIFNSLDQLDLDVYKAYSGEEAIEWLNRTRIDIVLTDIRMPEFDGMQLLAEIQKYWPQCKVIFLTGHSEFDYVYHAIQHSNVSYILKNEDHEKVISAVESAVNEIQKGMKIENLIHMAKEQMDMALDLFQKDFFTHLLHEKHSPNINQVQFDKLGIPMRPDQPVFLLISHVDTMPNDLSYWDKINFLYSIRLIIMRYFGQQAININVMDEDYEFVTLIQPKELTNGQYTQEETRVLYDRVSTFLGGSLDVIQSACRESLHTTVSFSMGGEPCGWANLSKKYNTLKQLLNFRIGKGTETILVDNNVENGFFQTGKQFQTLESEANAELIETLKRQRSMDNMGQYLESGNRELYFKLLSDLIDPIKSIKDKSSSIAIEAYYKVSLSMLSYINRWMLNDKLTMRDERHNLMDVSKFITWGEAAEFLYSLSETLFRLQNEEQKNRADTAIDYLRKFILDHLNEDLSLVRLAEQVFLNPSYLSRLFKQVKGINLSDFIDCERIKKAKELLEKDAVKINEVAKSTGYESAASFTRFFKRMVGCSPQDYQEAFFSGKQRKN